MKISRSQFLKKASIFPIGINILIRDYWQANNYTLKRELIKITIEYIRDELRLNVKNNFYQKFENIDYYYYLYVSEANKIEYPKKYLSGSAFFNNDYKEALYEEKFYMSE